MFNKILVVGDLHMRPLRGYADLIEDKRKAEEQQILDFIVEKSKGCDLVVLLGDELNSRNNTSEVTKQFTNFLERFDGKEVFITVGNHNKSVDGSTSLDYLKEVKNKKWHIITQGVEVWENLCFVPYASKNELGCDTSADATKKLMKYINAVEADVLFAHLSISGSQTTSGGQIDLFDEIILPRAKLEKKFKQTFSGHIHNPIQQDNVVVAGSVFNDEVGELRKYIWTIDNDMQVEQIPLPGRSIYKLQDPTFDELVMIPPSNTIMKVVLTKKIDDEQMEKIKKQLKKYDAHVLIEQYPNERRKLIAIEDGKSILDFDMPELLKIYAKQNKKDYAQLVKGWQLIQAI